MKQTVRNCSVAVLLLIGSYLQSEVNTSAGQHIWGIVAGIGDTVNQIQDSVGQSIGSSVDAIDSKVEHIISAIDNLSCSSSGCPVTPITGPYVITQPGTYCLATSFTATAGNGITIAASGVTLDLNEQTISGTGADNGIVINEGLSNVIVKNGAIDGMPNNGILLQGSTCTIDSCNLVNNTNGIEIQGGTNNTIKNCQALNNSTSGFSLINSAFNNVVQCKACGTGGSTNAYGFISTTGHNNIFDHCQAFDTQITATSPGSSIAGFALIGENNSNLTNSIINNTVAMDNYSIPYGILCQLVTPSLMYPSNPPVTQVPSFRMFPCHLIINM